MLPPSSSRVRDHRGEETDGEEDEDGDEEEEEEEEGSESQRRRCDRCGGVTDKAHFDRWTDVFGSRLDAADGDIKSGRVREGRRRLAELQVRRGKRR